jgi:hypothetical protein
MSVCPECQGVGYKKQLSYYQNVGGTAISPQLAFPPDNNGNSLNNQTTCTQCQGKGIKYSFGV